MSNDIDAVVRWLRERARMAQNVANNTGPGWRQPPARREDEAPYCAEAVFAAKFADEIERLFGSDQLASLRNKHVPLEGVTIEPLRRKRGRR